LKLSVNKSFTTQNGVKDYYYFNNKNNLIIKTRQIGMIFLALFPILFLSIFFYFPLISILNEGLRDSGGKFTLSYIASIIKDRYFLRIIAFTIEQALLSTIASTILGLPGAYILAKFDFKGKNFVKAITTVPFVLPSIIVVLGFVIFFGNNGLLNQIFMSLFNLEDPPLKILYSMKAIILAHTFYNFPICIRLVSAVWSRINPNIEKAAQSLGARGLTLFRYATLPQIMPGILASAALIFTFCFTSFAIILVLGGGPKYSTIEVEIYRLAKVSLNLKAGSALAIIESMLSLIFMYTYIKLQQKTSFSEDIKLHCEKKRLSEVLRSTSGIIAVIYLIATFFIIIAPMLSAVGYSFMKRSGWAGNIYFTLEWYKKIIFGITSSSITVSYMIAIRNSLFFGFMTVLFSIPLGTSIAYITTRKNLPLCVIIEALMMLPIGISSIILGLGYIKAYQNFPWDITGKWYAIVFAHTIIAYPFAIRAITAVFRKINPNIVKAAMCLGANRWKVFWRIELPLIKPGIIASAIFAFAISIGEVNATMMLYSPKLITMPVAIYRLISSYNYFAACALGTILIFICFLVFLLIDKMGLEIT